MTRSIYEAGKSEAVAQAPLENGTPPRSSSDRAGGEEVRHSAPAETLPEERADAPFAESKGLTPAELNDVIGADDYEAGADAPAAGEA